MLTYDARISTEVIVVGGGIVGCATAYYCARDGVNVTLLDCRRSDTGHPAATSVSCGSIAARLGSRSTSPALAGTSIRSSSRNCPAASSTDRVVG